MKFTTLRNLIIFLFLAAGLSACNKNVTVQSGDLAIEFNDNMYSRVNSTAEGTSQLVKNFCPSEYLVTKNFTADKFVLQQSSSEPVKDVFGKGVVTTLKGEFRKDGVTLTKIVAIGVYDNFPDAAVYNVSYLNSGKKDLQVKKWVNNHYAVLAQDSTPNFWSFQGSSSSARQDWILPLKPGFLQRNYMGMNASDYGGGIPVLDLWRKDCGLAIGHLAMVPKEVSFPVDYDKYADYANIDIENEYSDLLNFKAGDTLKTLPTFVVVHKGDYFRPLRMFSQLMQKKGIKFAKPEEEAFEPIWCGWGYMRKFTAEEILNTLPKVKELGIKWAVIDDGYQIAEGDWRVDTKRFPGGSKEMKKIVNAIHAQGLKAKLWWAPLAADPGSKILQDDPDVLLINKDGSPQYITWWDSYYMSPAYKGTIDYTLETVKMMMQDWGFDGLKLDGQHMNAVPPDYNWNRPLEYPEKSVEMLPAFFKSIYETAREIKPHAVIENCPCGTCMSFYNMPYTNQTVASDPTSSWQIRLKGKTYKAIMPQTAYYGDHVELSNGGDDFASSFGIGAVLGTKFTWPKDNPYVKENNVLTPEKEKIWKKWFSLYNKMMLSKGDYLGELYDIGYDIPETHVIKKGDTLFYAFYNKNWKGDVSLRGMSETKSYMVSDYFNNSSLGTVSGNSPQIQLSVNGFLLLKAVPEN